MAPTEAGILRSYLLAPSSLPTIISLAEFTALFPKARQNSPQIRTLYRDLQNQRDGTTAAVGESIDAEVKRASALRRAVANARKEAETQDADVEMDIERAVCMGIVTFFSFFSARCSRLRQILGSTDTKGPRRDLHAVVEELDGAVDELSAEVSQLQREEAELLASLRRTVGGLSDLRYGRLANGKLREQVHEGLAVLEEACKET